MSRRTRKNIGIIGLGIIGSRVRDVLRGKGYHVFVWNRTPRPIPNFVGAPAELAEMCDYLQIFVSDDDALLHIVRQLSPGLAPRHIVLAHSTVAPATMVTAAELVEKRGARFLEAPFTGSKEAAENGKLVYYVGGDEAALREARPLLEASGKEVLEFGEVGQATTIKLATNMITAASVQAAAEALALVQNSGVPLEKFAAAMQGNASNSATLNMKLPKMLERDFSPHFSVKHMLKDMQIANRIGLTNHLELGVAAAARDRLLEQMQRGRGDEDYSVIIKKYFPDGPTAAPASDMDLFEEKPPAAAAPPVLEPAVNAVPEPAPSLAPEPAPTPAPEPSSELVPEPGVFHEQTLDAPAMPGPPLPEFLEAPNELAPAGQGEGEGEVEAQDFSEEPLPEEEAQPRASFFSRLLRR